MLKPTLAKAILLFTLSFVIIFSAGKYGLIGKIYTEEEGEKLYGPAFETIEYDAVELISILDKCENYMMFTIKNGEVVITDDYRKILSNHKYQIASIHGLIDINDVGIIDDDEILNVFSKERVIELIESTGSKTVYFENRENVMTIRSGDDNIGEQVAVLEMASLCPPWCGDPF